MPLGIEAVTNGNLHLVERFEQNEADRLESNLLSFYLNEVGAGRLFHSKANNTFFGHFLFRKVPTDKIIVDRMVVAPDWRNLWLAECLKYLRQITLNPIQEPISRPVIYCLATDIEMCKALYTQGWFVFAEEQNYFGDTCYRFELPLDDFSDKYIAGVARRSRA